MLAQRKSSQSSMSMIPLSGMHSSGIMYKVSGLSGWPPMPSAIWQSSTPCGRLGRKESSTLWQWLASEVFNDDFGGRDIGKLVDFKGLIKVISLIPQHLEGLRAVFPAYLY